MKTIVVFGATGNTGIYVTDYLKAQLPGEEFSIIAVGRKNTIVFQLLGIPYYQIDITNASDFEKLPSADIVVHLAGILPAYLPGSDATAYIETNIQGTLNILEYCKRSKAKKILYAQSYADINANLVNDPVLRPYAPRCYKYTGDHAIYIFSKNMAVDMIEHYHQTYGISNIILRLPNIYLYSPQMTYYVDGIAHIIPYRYMIQRAIDSMPIELWGNPQKAKDVVYVKDYAQMVLLAAVSDVDSAIYNVGTGTTVTLEEQIKGIISVFSNPRNPSPIVLRPDMPDALSYVMDIQNARDELGYVPKYDYLSYLSDYKKEMEQNRFSQLWR